MSRTRKVGVLDVSKTIGAMIVTYGDDVNEVVDDAMKTVAEEAEESLRKVKTFSSKGNPTGEYSKDWDLLIEPVKRYSRRFVVYNVDHYQLTHLLESGHAKYLWGKETGGQVHKEKEEIWAKQTGVMKAVEVKNLPEAEMIIPVAVLCCFLKGESIIHNAAVLRTGKTDLLKSLVAELSHLGADIRVEGDSLKIRGKQVLSADACYSWNSEEISLAVLLASLRTEGELILMGENSDIIVKIFEKYKNFEKK